jgi:hypothetical protein
MVRFHVLIEHEAINEEWVARLDGLSGKFRDLGQKAQAFAPARRAAIGAATDRPIPSALDRPHP